MADATIWASGSELIPGPKGDRGDPGPANSLLIGTVTQGITANATITGSAPNQVLSLVLPQGSPGSRGLPGESPNITIGTVNSGPTAAATLTGTFPNLSLNLTLPILQLQQVYGAAFGFAEGYLTGVSVTAGVDLVWTTVKMDPAGLFPSINSADIVVPTAWDNKWFEIKANITQSESVAAETDTTSPIASQKLVIWHTRGGVTTKWRTSGAGAYTLGAKEVTSGPILLQTGDVIKLRAYSTSTSSPGLGAASFLHICPLGISFPA